MKKIVMIIFIVLLMPFAGCAGNSVKTLSQNEMVIAKAITSDVACTYEINGNKYSEWFVLDSNKLLTDLNSIASQKNYPELSQLKPDNLTMYTYNGDTWFVLTHIRDNTAEDGYNCISDIQLSLYNDGTEERQTRNGDYIYFLINLFTPGMAEKVADELSIFAEEQKSIPPIRQIVCGNVVYRFVFSADDSSEFYVLPARDPKFDEPASSAPFAIKPQ